MKSFTSSLCALILLATAALSHSDLTTSTPGDSATVAAPVTQIDLAFGDDVRLTRVHLTQDGIEAADLDLAGYSGFAKEFMFDVPELGAGAYQVEWRGLGVDGHQMTGTFSFVVE